MFSFLVGQKTDFFFFTFTFFEQEERVPKPRTCAEEQPRGAYVCVCVLESSRPVRSSSPRGDVMLNEAGSMTSSNETDAKLWLLLYADEGASAGPSVLTREKKKK